MTKGRPMSGNGNSEWPQVIGASYTRRESHSEDAMGRDAEPVEEENEATAEDTSDEERTDEGTA